MGGPREFSHEKGKTRGDAEAQPGLSDQGWSNGVWEWCRNPFPIGVWGLEAQHMGSVTLASK